MQDISDLIKEAKPLYFARKKRNNRIKRGLGAAACIALMFFAVPQKKTDDAFLDYWNLGYVETETASYVETLGLPVDDYGLLQAV